MLRYLQRVGRNAGKALGAMRPSGIICHDYRLIYYPVPKAASTSLKRYFATVLEIDFDRQSHTGDFPIVTPSQVGPYRDYTSFAIVRDPADRLYSCYQDKIGQSTADFLFPGFYRYNKMAGRQIFHHQMSFAEFVKVVRRIPDVLADEHFRSQYRLLHDPIQGLLPKVIIKLPDLGTELPPILAAAGLPTAQLPHDNDTETKPKQAWKTPEIMAQIRRRYRLDYRHFFPEGT